MLHHKQQPAVSYPTFPGNVEALSAPVSLPKRHSSQESPSTPSSPSPPSSSSTAAPPPILTTKTRNLEPSQPSKARGRLIPAACQSCRKRKSKVRVSCNLKPNQNRMMIENSYHDLTYDISVTVLVLNAPPALAKPLPASTWLGKARHINKHLERNFKLIEWLCLCYEKHRLAIQK